MNKVADKVNPRRPKLTDIQSVLQGNSRDPIYIINTADEVSAEGEVCCAIPNPNNQSPDILRIDQTWIPIDLTDKIPRKQLIESTAFRQLINSGLVKLVDSGWAQAVLSDPQAKSELQRLRNQQNMIRNALKSKTLQDISKNIQFDNKDDADGEADKQVKTKATRAVKMREEAEAVNMDPDEDDGPSVSPNAAALGASLSLKEDADIMNILRGRKGLSLADVAYLRGILETAGKVASVKFIDRVLEANGKSIKG